MRLMYWMSAFLVAIALVVAGGAEEVEACTLPIEIYASPQTAVDSPLSLAQGTQILKAEFESSYYELAEDSLTFTLRDATDAVLPLAADISLDGGATLRAAFNTASLGAGAYTIEYVPDASFDHVSEGRLHFEIVAQSADVVIQEPTLGLNQYDGGTLSCCNLAQNECISSCEDDVQECQQCFYDQRLHNYLIAIEYEVERAQTEVQIFLNGELERSTNALYPRTEVSVIVDPAEGPYCVRLAFVDVSGNVIGEMDESCFDEIDFPELPGPLPVLNDMSRCESSPIPEGEDAPGPDEEPGPGDEIPYGDDGLFADDNVEPSCSSTGASPAFVILLLLGMVGTLRRRRVLA